MRRKRSGRNVTQPTSLCQAGCKSKRLCDGGVSRKAARDLATDHMDEVNGYAPGEPILREMTLTEYWDKHYICSGQNRTSSRAPCTVTKRHSVNISKRVSATLPSKRSPPYLQQNSSANSRRMGKASAPPLTRSGLARASSNMRLQPASQHATLFLMLSAW